MRLRHRRVCAFGDKHKAHLTGSHRSVGHWPHGVQIAPRTYFRGSRGERLRNAHCGTPQHRNPAGYEPDAEATPTGMPVSAASEDVGAPAAPGASGGPLPRWKTIMRPTAMAECLQRTSHTTEPDPGRGPGPRPGGSQWRALATNLLEAPTSTLRADDVEFRLHRVSWSTPTPV